jgi:cell division protein FtsA
MPAQARRRSIIAEGKSDMAVGREKLIGALDIGSHKVCCFIARPEANGNLKVIGIGHQLSAGIKAGNVVDMEETETSIRAAVDAAERMAGEPLESLYVSLSAGNPQSHALSVDVAIDGHEVEAVDIQNVLYEGRQRFSPEGGAGGSHGGGNDVIHALPISYTVDGAAGVKDPRGLYGDRLGVDMHIITASPGPRRNLETCIARCHLKVADFVISPYASGLSCLVEDEKSLGVLCLDMGGGTTSLSVWMEGAMVYTDIIPIGGNHVTSDIARGLLTPTQHAERLKTLFGSAMSSPNDDRELLDVPQMGESDSENTTRIPRSILNGIIRPRLEETFELVHDRLVASGLEKAVGRRMVLTGGASQLSGARDLASRILEKQARIGHPLRVNGLADAVAGPAFSTAAGILAYASGQSMDAFERHEYRPPKNRFVQIGRWIKENF